MADEKSGLIVENADGVHVVVLQKDGHTLEEVPVSTQKAAEELLESWVNGTYKLLNE